MNIHDSTRAYLWWINAFEWDYLKYAEALYSDKDCKVFYPNWYTEEKKEELINNFLLNSKEYARFLQSKVNNEENFELSIIVNDISKIINDIIIFSPIK